MEVLSNVPFLSSSEFKVACETLFEEVQAVRDTTWDSAEVKEVVVSIYLISAQAYRIDLGKGTTVLVVRRPISGTSLRNSINLNQAEREDGIDEVDAEVDIHEDFYFFPHKC